jgi:glycosyltransferase involved in cell wall biosynthesis
MEKISGLKNFITQTERIETIIVGLAVRNEEKSLYLNLESIRKAIIASGEKIIKLIVCINGCTDRSNLIVEKFKEEHPGFKLDILESSEGLVTAQRKIVIDASHRASIYIFSDADIILDEDSIKLLMEALRADPNLIVAYARTKVFHDKENKSLFHKIALLRDSQGLLSKRFFFHGRLFATREWFIPTDDEILRRAKSSKRNSTLLKNYRGGVLLCVDDIFMSSYIMDKYGIGAIKQVEAAFCYAWSIGSLSDWYKKYRRRNIEMKKMYHWFPEYNYLKPYLNRHTDWKKWTRAGLKNKMLWILFLAMQLMFAILLHLELFLVNFNFYKPQKQWIITSTTKRSFHI